MATLHIYDGLEKLREIELTRESISLGRDESSHVVLEDASVSRRHAQVERTGNFYQVRDEGSTNGTYVNDMLVRVRLLAHGDVIRVGRYLLRVDARPAPRKESTRVSIGKLAQPKKKQSPEAAPTRVLLPPLRELQRFQQLRKLIDAIGYIHTREGLYEKSVEFLLADLRADRCGFLLLEDGASVESGVETGNFRPVAALSRDEAGTGPVEIRIDNQTLERALDGSDALLCEVPDSEEADIAMVAPLIDRGKVQGALYVDRAVSKRSFDEEQRLYFGLLAQQIATSLGNARLFADVVAEQGKVQAILTSLTDGIVVTDTDFRVTDTNIAAVVLLGLQSRNPIGQPLSGLFRDFDATPEPRFLAAEAREGSAIFHLRRRAGTNPGSGEQEGPYLAGYIVSYPRTGGGKKGYVVTLRDATQSRRLEQLKSAFISNVAHKLRNPLTVIEADLPMLTENLDSTSIRQELLDEIIRNSGALCHLVDQFVDYSEMDLRLSSEADVPAPASLRRIVTEAIRAKSAAAPEKAIRVENLVPEDLPRLTVRAVHLRDAVERIIDNSLKFSPRNSVVLIDAEVSGSLLKLHVTDEGCGIPAEEIDAVFYVGHQVDPQGTGQIPGAGLGLTIARHIVQQHGGDIRITSPYEPGDQGTRVCLMLPLRPESSPSPLAPADESRQSGFSVVAGEAGHAG